MNRDELCQLLKVPKETESIEFKEAKRDFGRRQLLEYCVAIANSGGGNLILGVTDKPPRQIVGTNAFRDLPEIQRQIRNKLGVHVSADEFIEPGGRIVVFTLPPRPTGNPLDLDGKYLMRSGDEVIPMPAYVIRSIFDESHSDFSAQICASATFDDLSVDAIQRLRTLYEERNEGAHINVVDDRQLLQDLGLVDEERITYASLILLGSRAAVSRYLPQAEVILEYRSSESSISHQDRREYQEGFLLFADQVWSTVNARNTHYSYHAGMLRTDIPALNEFVVREALLNAISHRDYRRQGSIFLRHFPVRLIVESPGGFPQGVNRENIIERQSPRNRLLADVLLKCGLVERSGQGVDRMFRESIQQGKSAPDYSRSDDYQVVLDLDGEIQDERFLRFLEKIGVEAMETFSTEDFLVLDLVHREEQLPERLRPRVSRLRDLGVLEVVGRGRGTRYLLSRRFYEHVGEDGTYTRRLGLDRETNKQLLLRHIDSNAERGCRLRELQEVLPGLSIDSVRTLLKDLRDEGKVHVRGRTRAARWYPGPETKHSDVN